MIKQTSAFQDLYRLGIRKGSRLQSAGTRPRWVQATMCEMGGSGPTRRLAPDPLLTAPPESSEKVVVRPGFRMGTGPHERKIIVDGMWTETARSTPPFPDTFRHHAT